MSILFMIDHTSWLERQWRKDRCLEGSFWGNSHYSRRNALPLVNQESVMMKLFLVSIWRCSQRAHKQGSAFLKIEDHVSLRGINAWEMFLMVFRSCDHRQRFEHLNVLIFRCKLRSAMIFWSCMICCFLALWLELDLVTLDFSRVWSLRSALTGSALLLASSNHQDTDWTTRLRLQTGMNSSTYACLPADMQGQSWTIDVTRGGRESVFVWLLRDSLIGFLVSFVAKAFISFSDIGICKALLSRGLVDWLSLSEQHLFLWFRRVVGIARQVSSLGHICVYFELKKKEKGWLNVHPSEAVGRLPPITDMTVKG